MITHKRYVSPIPVVSKSLPTQANRGEICFLIDDEQSVPYIFTANEWKQLYTGESENKQSLTPAVCVNCGASINMSKGKCEYCGTEYK